MTVRSVVSGVALALLLAAGCSPEAQPRVGLIVSANAVAAGRLAARADSLVPGTAIELEVVSVGSPAEAGPALDYAESLVADGVIAVIGHSNSGASLAASPVYNFARVVQIAPTSTATAYAQAGPFSFRMVSSDREQARTLAALARKLGKAGPVVVIYENDAYGYGLYRDLLPVLERAGVPVAGAGSYVLAELAAGAWQVVAALAEANPAALIWLGRAIPLDTVLPRLRARWPQLPVIASDGLDGPRTYENPAGVFAGLHFVRLLDPDSMAAARARVPAADGAALATAEAMLTYDAVMLVAAAVRAGARTGDDVRRYLWRLGRGEPAYRGLTGLVRFDEQRSVQRPWSVGLVTPDGVIPVTVDLSCCGG